MKSQLGHSLWLYATGKLLYYVTVVMFKSIMVRNPEIKLPESRVRRKPQARFGEGQTEKEQQYYLAGCLLYTSDGRKLGLDPRLIDPSFEDNPDTKLNRCVENVARIHAETAEDRLTQIIFCDLGVPHKAAEAAVEGEDADDAKDKKSIAEVESLEEECDFCVYEQTLSNGYTLTHTYFNSGFSPSASPLSRNL